MFLWLYICPLHLYVFFDTNKGSGDHVDKMGTVIPLDKLI